MATGGPAPNSETHRTRPEAVVTQKIEAIKRTPESPEGFQVSVDTQAKEKEQRKMQIDQMAMMLEDLESRRAVAPEGEKSTLDTQIAHAKTKLAEQRWEALATEAQAAAPKEYTTLIEVEKALEQRRDLQLAALAKKLNRATGASLEAQHKVEQLLKEKDTLDSILKNEELPKLAEKRNNAYRELGAVIGREASEALDRASVEKDRAKTTFRQQEQGMRTNDAAAASQRAKGLSGSHPSKPAGSRTSTTTSPKSSTSPQKPSLFKRIGKFLGYKL